MIETTPDASELVSWNQPRYFRACQTGFKIQLGLSRYESIPKSSHAQGGLCILQQ